MNITIPEGAIVYDLEGDYIYPSFIDLYTNYGLPEIKKGIYSMKKTPKARGATPKMWNGGSGIKSIRDSPAGLSIKYQ